MYPSRKTHKNKQRQHGAAFIVMLVILIMGVTFYLVSALSKVSLQNARDERSADLLAQAKEVLIGYMLRGSGGTPPGGMMYPDVLDTPSASEKSTIDGTTPMSNYDGEWEGGCFNKLNSANTPPYTPLTGPNANMRCLGRLPWKSLGMSISTPSENDPTGFMPWYAFSRNLIDFSKPINSELLDPTVNTYPWLKVYDMNGVLLSDRVAFVIIVPGPALPNQSRPPSPNLGNPDQYLDKISFPVGCSPTGTPCTTTYSNYDLNETFITGPEHRWMNDPANPGKQIEDPNYHFNDKLLYVTIDELMPLIEKRIAREVKSCLDDYAAASSFGNYPWPAPVTDTNTYPNRLGVFNTLFGRISDVPSNATSIGGGPYDATTTTLLNTLALLQQLLNNYPGSTSNTTLKNAGISLANAAQNANTLPSSVTNLADTAGDRARDLANGVFGVTKATVQSLINTTNTALVSAGITSATTDSTMPSSWSSITSCNTLINTSTYWNDWRDLVFYQISAACQPGSTTCSSTTANLSISGSGNPNPGSGHYRAAVIVAGKALGTQTRPSYTTPPNNYLANTAIPEQSTDPAFVTNAHDNAGSSTSFITYKTSDPYYQSVNDLVLCLDGKNNCK